MAQQAVLPDLLHATELVPKHARQDLRPQYPVQEADPEDGPARDGVRPVRERRVRVGARRRLDEGYDKEEDVDRAEEEGGDERGELDARPVGVWEEGEVYDSEGYQGVDDGEGV